MGLRRTILALLVILFACGCEKKPSSQSSTLLQLNLSHDPCSLDPRMVRLSRDLTLVKQLFEGLMRLDEKGQPMPALCERYSLSADKKEYTFYLRDALWSNQKPVTAFDFEYAWKKTLDPQFASDYASMLFPLKNAQKAKQGLCSLDEVGVKALDEKRLVVVLERPTPYFLELLAFPTTFPIPAGLDESTPNWAAPPATHLITNGPFQLNEWKFGSTLTLTRNSTYWDQKNVFLDGLHFTVLADTTTENYLYEKGELDWLGMPLSQNLPTEVASHYREDKKLLSYPVAGTFWIKCNLLKSPTSDVKIRKALATAISRKELVEHILQGHQQIATTLLPPSMALATHAYVNDGEAAEAKRLLDEGLAALGISLENLPSLSLTLPTSERNIKIGEFLQESWRKELHIEVTLDICEREYYKSKVRAGDFQLALGDWIADFNDPLSFLELFKEKSHFNETGWENERFIALVDRASDEIDLAKRSELLREAEALFMNDMAIIPLYHHAFDFVKRDAVRDVALSPLGLIDFKSAKKG